MSRNPEKTYTDCECGGRYTSNNSSNHMKSQKHQYYVERGTKKLPRLPGRISVTNMLELTDLEREQKKRYFRDYHRAHNKGDLLYLDEKTTDEIFDSLRRRIESGEILIVKGLKSIT